MTRRQTRLRGAVWYCVADAAMQVLVVAEIIIFIPIDFLLVETGPVDGAL